MYQTYIQLYTQVSNELLSTNYIHEDNLFTKYGHFNNVAQMLPEMMPVVYVMHYKNYIYIAEWMESGHASICYTAICNFCILTYIHQEQHCNYV